MAAVRAWLASARAMGLWRRPHRCGCDHRPSGPTVVCHDTTRSKWSRAAPTARGAVGVGPRAHPVVSQRATGGATGDRGVEPRRKCGVASGRGGGRRHPGDAVGAVLGADRDAADRHFSRRADRQREPVPAGRAAPHGRRRCARPTGGQRGRRPRQRAVAHRCAVADRPRAAAYHADAIARTHRAQRRSTRP
eukprot:ctg_756.g366